MLSKWALASMLVSVGLVHFALPAPFLAIMPPGLPQPLALVYLSGLAEIALGIGLVIPRVSRASAWGIMALLVAVFPANVHHALADGLPGSALPEMLQSRTLAILRLPFQLVFIAWAYSFTRPKRTTAASESGQVG